MSADRSRPLAVTHAVDHPVYAVAGGNHVSLLLHRDDAGCLLDVIEVLAQPGGGPPPHRHAFAEWFHFIEGQLTLSTVEPATDRASTLLSAPGFQAVARPVAAESAAISRRLFLPIEWNAPPA